MLQAEDITDWQRGEDTLPQRMSDYTIGLMNGKWENTIHVLHMYSVTERCDCVNATQQPMLKRDIGFLVGKNPFVIDQLAGRILADALRDEGRQLDEKVLHSARAAARHVEESHELMNETRLERIAVR